MDTKQVEVKKREAHAVEDQDDDQYRRGGRDDDAPLAERDGE